MWYSPKQVDYLKKAQPKQLNIDYAKYLTDMVKATTQEPEGQYLLKFNKMKGLE